MVFLYIHLSKTIFVSLNCKPLRVLYLNKTNLGLALCILYKKELKYLLNFCKPMQQVSDSQGTHTNCDHMGGGEGRASESLYSFIDPSCL